MNGQLIHYLVKLSITCLPIASLSMFSLPTIGLQLQQVNNTPKKEINFPVGQQIFAASCAGCHADSLQSTAPKLSLLRQMNTRAIYESLKTGKMFIQAAALSDEQRKAVAEWINGQPLEETVLPSSAYTSFSLPENVKVYSGWGGNKEGTGFIPGSKAGITPENVKTLQVKWVFAFPQVLQMRNKPAIVGEWLLIGSQFGDVFAIHQKTGKIGWHFTADATIRGSIFVAQLSQGLRAYFADFSTNVYALDVATGKLIWKKRVGQHPQSSVTGSVAVYADKVIVPLSSLEVFSSKDSTYACCTSSGEVVALDAVLGEEKWRHRVVDEQARVSGTKRNGDPFYGPSGAPVWCSPTIDTLRNRVYIGTGENYTAPATTTSDAVQALDLNTGKLIWTFQATSQDTWNTSCPGQPNCPDNVGPDLDFGMAPLLIRPQNGKDMLVAGQKSGVVHALDAATGQVLWQTRIGKGGVLGGVHWGMATDGTYLYAANNDRTDVIDKRDSTLRPSPGLYALEVATGKVLWQQPTPYHESPPLWGNSAAPLLVPGVVFAGSLDGNVRAYDAIKGDILWEFNTAQEFTTVNGVTGKGGTIDGPSPVAWDGMLFVNSGYGFLGEAGGNVLIAFEIEKK
ncbi:PQQ-binding-like beta-propeller repeat protein [Catalinimonas sp. 4WD22]|uniref:outer membrane protein assembly factor BamB family protein n=1 Tax=Catalinimonas locisalis TaxID=3133978 RepID=UPI003100FAC6